MLKMLTIIIFIQICNCREWNKYREKCGAIRVDPGSRLYSQNKGFLSSRMP